MKHRGEIIEQAVRQSGYSITQVAKRLGKSRRHVYNLFENPQVPIETMLEIGRIIHVDFTDLLPQNPVYPSTAVQEQLSGESNITYTSPEHTVEFWKNKYLMLLEKYNALLEGKGSFNS
jgi:predicted transcriptional regulator